MSETPPGWVSTTLGDIACPTQERVVPSTGDDRIYVGLEHVQSGTTKIIGSSRASELRSATMRFDAGDTLYGRLRPYLNKVCLPTFGGLASSEFIVFKSDPALAPGFLLYLLNSSEFVRFASLVNDGDRPRVKWNQMRAFPIGLPPLDEQRRIVEAIEGQLSRLDAADRYLDGALKRLDQMRASVMRLHLGGDWPTASIADICDPTRKIAYGVLQPGKHEPDGTPLVRVSDIVDGQVSLDDLKLIDPSIADRYPRTRLCGGEVLLTIVGTIGRSAVAPDALAGANVARAVAVIPVRADCSAEFVSLALGTAESKAALVGLAHEVARKTLNLEDVRSFRLALAPLAEQQRIVSLVGEHMSLIDALRSGVGTASRRSAALRRAVLRDAFTGQLVPHRQPDDSTATSRTGGSYVATSVDSTSELKGQSVDV